MTEDLKLENYLILIFYSIFYKMDLPGSYSYNGKLKLSYSNMQIFICVVL